MYVTLPRLTLNDSPWYSHPSCFYGELKLSSDPFWIECIFIKRHKKNVDMAALDGEQMGG